MKIIFYSIYRGINNIKIIQIIINSTFNNENRKSILFLLSLLYIKSGKVLIKIHVFIKENCKTFHF